MVSRFKFKVRRQKDEETVSEFVVDVRRLSEFCNYICPYFHKSILGILLCDSLVCVVRDSRTKRLLLVKDNTLTFELALSKATVMEVADRNAINLQQARNTETAEETEVNNIQATETQARALPVQQTYQYQSEQETQAQKQSRVQGAQSEN